MHFLKDDLGFAGSAKMGDVFIALYPSYIVSEHTKFIQAQCMNCMIL